MIQLPALLLWVAALLSVFLWCYGSSWKPFGFVEWWRGCAIRKLHCEGYVPIRVPASSWWESSTDGAVPQRLPGTGRVASDSCWFYFLAGSCPRPGITTCICTSLEEKAESAPKTCSFQGIFCKKQDHLGAAPKCMQVSTEAQRASAACCWDPDIWGCDGPGSQTLFEHCQQPETVTERATPLSKKQNKKLQPWPGQRNSEDLPAPVAWNKVSVFAERWPGCYVFNSKWG